METQKPGQSSASVDTTDQTEEQVQTTGIVPPEHGDLRPELRPIAARHGREMLDFAVRVSACNVALDQLVAYAQTHSKLRPITAMLTNAQAELAQMVMTAKGWDWDKLVECIGDVGRAGKLAANVRNVQGPGTSGPH